MATNKNQEREAREARERLKLYTARQSVHEHQLKRRKRDNLVAIIAVVVVVALAAAVQVAFFTAGPGMPVPSPSASASASPSATPAATENVGDVPDSSVAEDRDWTGTLTLNSTVLDITLDGKAAPQAVASFVQDAKDGFFTGTTCPRLVSSEGTGLLQCGSTTGTTASDSTYGYGPLENVPADGIYKSGVIAVARVEDQPYSQGHQFFIVFGDIDLGTDNAGGYTVIGTVTKGIDALTSDIVAGGIVTNATSTTDGEPNVATTITALTIK